MKKDSMELVFILDESGSMEQLRQDVIGGFNSIFNEQKKKGGDITVSLVTFSTVTKVIYDRVPIDKVKPLTEEDYIPNGGTALLDAVGGAIHHIGNVHKYARAEDVPEKTMFFIMTDGMENSSVRYDYATVKRQIVRQEEKYGWAFLYSAANIDAAASAGRIGIRASRARQFEYSSAACDLDLRITNEMINRARSTPPVDLDWLEDEGNDVPDENKALFDRLTDKDDLSGEEEDKKDNP